MEAVSAGEALMFISAVQRLIVEVDIDVGGRTGLRVLDQCRGLHGYCIVDPPEKGDAAAVLLAFIDVFPALQGILEISGVLAFESAEADGEIAAHRNVHLAPRAVPVTAVLRRRAIDLGAGGKGTRVRFRHDVLEKAADAARAVQCSLRPAQHFDVVQIERIEVRDHLRAAGGFAEGRVIDGDTHRRIADVGGSDSA